MRDFAEVAERIPVEDDVFTCGLDPIAGAAIRAGRVVCLGVLCAACSMPRNKVHPGFSERSHRRELYLYGRLCWYLKNSVFTH